MPTEQSLCSKCEIKWNNDRGVKDRNLNPATNILRKLLLRASFRAGDLATRLSELTLFLNECVVVRVGTYLFS